MPFFGGRSYNSVPFEINHDHVFAALKRRPHFSYTEFPQSQSDLRVFPKFMWVCMLCVCPLLESCCFERQCPCFCRKEKGPVELELMVGPECELRGAPGDKVVGTYLWSGACGERQKWHWESSAWMSVERCSESFREKTRRKTLQPWNCSHKIPICLQLRYARLHCSPSDFSGATPSGPSSSRRLQQATSPGRELEHCSLAPGDTAEGCQVQGRDGTVFSLSSSFCPAYWQRISHQLLSVPPLTLTSWGHPTGPITHHSQFWCLPRILGKLPSLPSPTDPCSQNIIILI